MSWIVMCFVAKHHSATSGPPKLGVDYTFASFICYNQLFVKAESCGEEVDDETCVFAANRGPDCRIGHVGSGLGATVGDQTAIGENNFSRHETCFVAAKIKAGVRNI